MSQDNIYDKDYQLEFPLILSGGSVWNSSRKYHQTRFLSVSFVVAGFKAIIHNGSFSFCQNTVQYKKTAMQFFKYFTIIKLAAIFFIFIIYTAVLLN